MRYTTGFKNSGFRNVKNVTKEKAVTNELCACLLKHSVPGEVCIRLTQHIRTIATFIAGRWDYEGFLFFKLFICSQYLSRTYILLKKIPKVTI